MKRLFLLMIASLATLSLAAQPVLRESTHGVLPGYPNPMILSELSTPGVEGKNVVWDFSAMPQKGPFRGEVVDPSTMSPEMELMSANSCLVENSLQAFLVSSRKQLLEVGCRIAGSDFLRIYDKPIVKHKYPFRYGDKIVSQGEGRDIYGKGRTVYNFGEEVTIHADAYGTLILPGSTLKDVLRVKWVRSRWFVINGKKSTVYTHVEYRWYVKSHRYPVLSVTFDQDANGNLSKKSAICAYNPIVDADAVIAEAQKEALSKKEVKEDANALASVSVRPNPFNENLRVQYKLANRANVIISLYNIQGYLVKTLYQGVDEAGTFEKTFTNQINGLPQGAYVLRVESEGKALTQKLLKI